MLLDDIHVYHAFMYPNRAIYVQPNSSYAK